MVLVVGIALAGLTEFLPSWARGFVAGVWLASVVWFLVFLVVQLSGTASLMMGTTAEQWTAQELRKLRPRGWKVVSHTIPKYGDIDHIAIGPGGLLVVETKWRSDPTAFDDQDWLTAECRKLSENARLIRLSLQARLQDAPTRTAFVCWSPGGSSDRRSEPVEMEGMTVVSGPGLSAWLDDELGHPPSSVKSRPVQCLEVANADGVTALDFTSSDFAQIRDQLQRELGRGDAALEVITRDLSPEAAGQTATRIQALLGRIVGV